MLARTCFSIIAASLAVALALPAAAHHASAGQFDQTRTIEVSGTVKEWRFVNPHPVLVLSVTDKNGTTNEWDVYFGPAAVSFLKTRGYQLDSFTPGQAIIVKGHPAITTAYAIDVFGSSAYVTKADGTRIPQAR